ncbi:glycosyltransferase [Vulcanisaeta thermophila]|uniref:glycosyltransferase n=1 Tax=Vulcanisaeta thermophila TaxID=867917 RepID=UPI0008537B41|nr:glycosyltransferase [Vulcanisaeta thermophila]
MKPYISVLITAYNRRGYLRFAVKSVLNQNFDKPFEVIIIKNFEDPYVDKLSITKGNIKVLNLSNEPIGAYIARGLEEAEGEVVTFLDDDDAFRSNKLKYLYNIFSTNDNIGYFHHLAYVINSENKVIGESIGGPIKEIKLKLEDNLKSSYLCKLVNIGSIMSSIAVRRDVLIRWLPYLRKLFNSPDLFVTLAAFYSGVTLLHEPIKLAYYRVHGNQVSLPWSQSIEVLKVRFMRSSIMNYYGFEYLRSVFRELDKIPLWCNPLGGYSYNVVGLVLRGADRRKVLRVSSYALLRGLMDRSPWRVLSGFLGLLYQLDGGFVRYLINKYYVIRYGLS